MSLFLLTSPGLALEGISSYYLRYDVQSKKNQIRNERLTMVPAEDEFRAENFSLHERSGLISSHQGTPQPERQAREQILKSLLMEKGLKSLKTLGTDTIVSYEGVIHAPIRIKTWETKGNTIRYRAHIQFAPLAFPDQWEKLSTRHQIKQTVQNFLFLFK